MESHASFFKLFVNESSDSDESTEKYPPLFDRVSKSKSICLPTLMNPVLDS